MWDPIIFPFCFSPIELDFLSLVAKGILTDITQGDRVKRDDFRDPSHYQPNLTMALRIFHLGLLSAFPPWRMRVTLGRYISILFLL